ncbi:MAG: peptidase MA family metallohydrolase [Candidatus Omnitrophota bacterium]
MFIGEDYFKTAMEMGIPFWSGVCINSKEGLIIMRAEVIGAMSSLLIHELTHLVIETYVGKNLLPLWLDEGIATYMTEKYGLGVVGRESYVKNAIMNNTYIKFNDLNGMADANIQSLSSDDSEIFYAESFSVVKFLKEKYKKESFSDFLSCLRQGNSLDTALSKTFNLDSFDMLEVEWKKNYQGK